MPDPFGRHQSLLKAFRENIPQTDGRFDFQKEGPSRWSKRNTRKAFATTDISSVIALEKLASRGGLAKDYERPRKRPILASLRVRLKGAVFIEVPGHARKESLSLRQPPMVLAGGPGSPAKASLKPQPV
jgi:hypothetical protein